MDPDISDYDLGNSLAAQRELLEYAFTTNDDSIVEQALLRVTAVRRMAKAGILDWQRPDDNH